MRYISTVLDLKLSEGVMVLDEVFPLGVRELLEGASQLMLEARIGGAMVTFSSEFISSAPQAGVQCYHLAIPSSVDYLQRREGHRVNVAELGIHAELYDHNGKVHRGQLKDISTGGISLSLARVDGLHRNDVYRCAVQLPSSAPFLCHLDIGSIRKEGDNLVLGGSFVELDRHQEILLARVVAELERSLMRRRWEPVEASSAD